MSNSDDLKARVDFDLLRYANCWEDAEVLLAGLRLEPGGRILSIASAGDNSLSLLTTDPALVVAVDISPTQLYLTELKKICVGKLDRNTTLEFLGFEASTNRKAVFNSIKFDLDSATRNYWETNLPLLEKGIIHQGKFERYFQLFSRKILPLIHGDRKIEKLLSIKSEAAQREFYETQWNTWRWRLLFRLFFSKYVMGKYGRDPEFLRQVQGSVSATIYRKAAEHLASVLAQDNYILRYALTGNFGHSLPHYLLEENYGKIQRNINRLQTHCGYAQAAIPKFGKFDRMNLSNIFEYMDGDQFQETARALGRGTEPGGRLAYWNLMVPRIISEVLPETVKKDELLSRELTRRDRGFFYREFVIDQLYSS